MNTEERNGICSWILSTDHKRIGLLYLYSVLGFFLAGVVIGLLMRLELIAPGRTMVSVWTYDSLFTLHGIIMIFFFVIERAFGTGFFDPEKGGDPLMFEHLFRIYSHPAVYVMILPAMGIISEIVPTFSHKTVFRYKAVVFSGLSIASLGYVVRGHNMFTSGMLMVPASKPVDLNITSEDVLHRLFIPAFKIK